MEKLLAAYKRFSQADVSEKYVKTIELEYKQVTEMYKFTTG
jgi:hypothetical protein